MNSDTYSFRWGIDLLDGGHVEIPNFMIRSYIAAGVKRHEMLLVIHLATYKWEAPGSQCRPSLATIARQMGCTVQRVCQILNGLEKRGLLIRTRREKKTTIYDFGGLSRAVLAQAISDKADANTCRTQANLSGVLKPILHEEETVTRKEIHIDQSKTPVSPTAVSSHHYTDKEKKAFIAELGNAPPPKRIKHTPEEIMASTKRASARGWANRASSGETTHRAFEKALARYGDDAPALRELHEQIETNFGLAPNWSSVAKVKEWTNGLSELYAAARGDISIAIAAAKKLRNDSMTMATPHSIVGTAQSIAAERATAYVAPSARAVKEYV